MSAQIIYSALSSRSDRYHHINRYIQFIFSCQEKSGCEIYVENHHILPAGKSLYPEYRDFNAHPWNRVKLTPRQHFIAHLMIAKIFPTNITAISAVRFMSKQANKNASYQKHSRSRYYEKFRKEFSELISADKERAAKIGKSQKGKYVPIEVRQNLSRIATLRNSSYESREKFGKLIRKTISEGKMWWQNDATKSKYIENRRQYYDGMPHDKKSHLFGKSGRDKAFFHNSQGEMIRVKKGEPVPDGFTQGRVNFGKNGNFFNTHAIGIDVRTNLPSSIHKNDIGSKYIVPHNIKKIFICNNQYSHSIDIISKLLGVSQNSLAEYKRTSIKRGSIKLLPDEELKIMDLADYRYDHSHEWL